jgi:predicted acyl esterase
MLRLIIVSFFSFAIGCLLLVLSCSGMGAETSEESQRSDAVEVHNEMVPMRDGIALSTDIFRPKAEGRLRVLRNSQPSSRASSFVPRRIHSISRITERARRVFASKTFP